MHRIAFWIASLVLVASVGGGLLNARTAAQDGTPAPGGPIAVVELAPGVTAEIFGAAPSAGAPGHTLYVARVTFAPGAELYAHTHPGTTLIGVESGSLGWTLAAGTVHVVRGAAGGAAGPAEDLTTPGTDVILEPGDGLYYEADVVHTARGAADGPTVLLASFVLEAGQPLLMPVDMTMPGTPAP